MSGINALQGEVMAKSSGERRITRGIAVGTRTYRPGEEDALASALGETNVDRLVEKGYLVGDWSGGRSESGETADEVTLADLPGHISSMSADEVKALQKRDERKGAVPIYEARLGQLES